jgi:hypothetical protein
MRLWGWRRDPDRGLDFQKTLLDKKSARRLEQGSARL